MKTLLRLGILLIFLGPALLSAQTELDVILTLSSNIKESVAWVQAKDPISHNSNRSQIKAGDVFYGYSVGKMYSTKEIATNPRTGIKEERVRIFFPLVNAETQEKILLPEGITIRLKISQGVQKPALAQSPLYTIVPGVDVYLEDNYGFILVNEGDKKNPKPRYILGIRSTGKVTDTQNLEIFAGALKAIPRGATVFEYDSCTVSRSWGLSDKQREDFRRAFKEAGLKVSAKVRITCYCEASEGKR